ncbi:MAG: TIGR01459 family HAD-type hydrolase [Lactobacillaceae bacterium]|jgi:HAD superfamily hydrolase (TIGR01459 family)|nr:TIGR01459 family HAD-type hydrolase [Lactobacillaceae bacterium]
MLDNILKIENKFDVFMFDLYGVLWDGCKLINEADTMLKELRKQGKAVVILSNAALRAYSLEDKYAERGLIKGRHYDKFVTSGEMAYDYFSNDKKELKYYVFRKPNPGIFTDSRYKRVSKAEDADFIYAGLPSILEGEEWKTTTSMEPFMDELNMFKKLKKPMICINPDLKTPAGDGKPPFLCEGSVALAYQELGGDVEFIGKPYPEVFDFALQDYPDTDDNRILMIGDTLETDILGANSYGIKSALVTTGISYDNMMSEGLSNIKEYAKALDIEPNFYF